MRAIDLLPYVLRHVETLRKREFSDISSHVPLNVMRCPWQPLYAGAGETLFFGGMHRESV